ncbi:low temperature requirement protein A [Micromonospora soli]|uniref:low temperature requirement protein A n=1 Tax=Micromonospora sp. NBRC 110009 TaxID=3061627 RepID=UPI002672CD35|nr:low temperature requirement protein A [Micromonospora sp. NBRC 110009]WKT98469.1 low temperature requirement protein A [Micromonospora sp. NBRC 110009]
MTTGRFHALLRRPEQGRTAFLELFFDLVFVLAFFQLSQQLLEHLSWTGAFQTLVLLLPVLHLWAATTRLLDAFDPRHPLVQLLTMPIIFGTLVLAAAAPEAFGRRGLVFAGAYLTIRLGGLAIAIHVLRGHEAQRSAVRIFFWVGMSAPAWIAGALLPDTVRAALWMTATVAEYAALALGFPTPKLGRHGPRRLEIVVSEEHLAERYQQFFIIALGEPILVTGLTFANGEFGADRSTATVLAFATTALLWRIYIHRAGELLAGALAASHNPLRVGVLVLYAHVIMVAAIVAVAVGDEIVITHPLGHPDPAWIAVILGGPALFLAGRAIFEYGVFGRMSLPRVIGALALLALTPRMRPAPPLAAATTAALILTGVAVADALRTRRLPSEQPSPPG